MRARQSSSSWQRSLGILAAMFSILITTGCPQAPGAANVASGLSKAVNGIATGRKAAVPAPSSNQPTKPQIPIPIPAPNRAPASASDPVQAQDGTAGPWHPGMYNDGVCRNASGMPLEDGACGGT